MTSPRFSVGQRVRVIAAYNFPELIGTVCRVTSEYRPHNDLSTGRKVWGYDLNLPHPDPAICGPAYAAPECLEPLDDDQFEPGSWSELADIWKPEGVRC